MLGFYRAALAAYVVVYHLSELTPFAGPIAVFAFYTLSGYLITLVITRVYKSNMAAFLTNRAIRIYSTYWLCLLISLSIILVFPQRAAQVYPTLLLPDGLNIIENLFVFGLLDNPEQRHPTLLPSAWSLNIELVYYLIMATGLTRSRTMCLACFFISGVLILSAIFNPWRDVYFSFVYPGFAFSVGATAYHYRRAVSKGVALVLMAVGLIGPTIPALIFWLTGYYWFTLSLIIAPVFAVCAIYGATSIRLPERYAKIDSVAGDMSYPIFLLHLPMAVLASLALLETHAETCGLLILAIALTATVSFAIAMLFEPMIRRWRNEIRSHRSEASMTPGIIWIKSR